jgi:hypothetical protein
VPGITGVRGPKTDLDGASSFQKTQALPGLPRRAARTMTTRSNHRDTPKNDRNPDTSDLSINGLSSAIWYQSGPCLLP